MKESIMITRIVYGLYLIILGIFGVLVGFLFGVYSRKKDLYIDEFTLFLLLLLKLLAREEFNYLLLLLKLKNKKFSSFSLEFLESIDSSPLKIMLEEPHQTPQIPFPLLMDPLFSIDVEYLFLESENCQFDLVTVYRTLNRKLKY